MLNKEEQITPEEPLASATEGVVPKPMILLETEPAHPERSLSPMTAIQKLTLPSGEGTLEENLNEETLPTQGTVSE